MTFCVSVSSESFRLLFFALVDSVETRLRLCLIHDRITADFFHLRKSDYRIFKLMKENWDFMMRCWENIEILIDAQASTEVWFKD